jgi:toluene monooxygenase system protein E
MSTAKDLSQPLKTWSHLAANRRRPTEYEIVSTRVLWNTPNHTVPWKMAGATPVIQWIVKNRNGSRLRHDDWNAFRDPDCLVYRTYCLMQDGQESYVDGLLDDYSKNDHDAGLAPAWLEVLAQLYAPARYVVHAVQMASGYMVALAPSSTVANCFMFQCGDQLRWVSRIAYRTVELAGSHPDLGFGANERQLWEKSAPWRGFVELAERALTAWDWSESFTAVNLVLKPAIDEALLRQLGRVARETGDTLTGALLDAQMADSQRSRRFSGALVKFLREESGDNRKVFDEWLEKWAPLGDRAIDAFCRRFDERGEAGEMAKLDAKAFRVGLGLAL